MAPKYPYPYGIEYCYAAPQWVASNAGYLGIDPDKIAIYGNSAGGALAASVTQMARDRKGPNICYQMLIYPVTDMEQSTDSIKEYTDIQGCNSKSVQAMWEVYLNTNKETKYASPLHADSFKCLPPAYISVAEYDCLRDEGILYAKKLEKSGIPVEMHIVKNAIHGFDVLVKDNEIIHESIKRRIQALRKVFRIGE